MSELAFTHKPPEEFTPTSRQTPLEMSMGGAQPRLIYAALIFRDREISVVTYRDIRSEFQGVPPSVLGREKVIYFLLLSWPCKLQ